MINKINNSKWKNCFIELLNFDQIGSNTEKNQCDKIKPPEEDGMHVGIQYRNRKL